MCPKGGGRGRGAAARPFASHTFLSMAHTPTTIALVRSVVDASSMKDAEALRRRPTCEPAWIPAPLPSPRTYSAPGVVGTLAGSIREGDFPSSKWRGMRKKSLAGADDMARKARA